MSHEATAWAFKQRGLKPSAKLVLLALADCHNPSYGCFPSQAFLADACEINRDTVNVQLNLLEERGLIRRVRRYDAVTKRQRPTCYKLAFEEDFDADEGMDEPRESKEKAVSDIPTEGRKAVSEKHGEPCRKNGASRVGKPDSNLVIEQVNKPACAREAGATDLSRFELFWQAHPKPRNRNRSLELFQASEKTGADRQFIIRAAERYRERSRLQDPRYVAASDLWLERRGWEEEGQSEGRARVSPDVAFWADKVRAGSYVPPNAVSPAKIASMLENGLVSEAQLRHAGIRV